MSDAAASPLRLQRASIRLDTRLGSPIANNLDRTACSPGIIAQCGEYARKYPSARRRPTEPTAVYNCHGMTFGSRRTGISNPATVRKILAEDDYVSVESANVCVGDVVAYLEDGDISHSGVVVELRQSALGLKAIWVMSKWGDLPEYIHELRHCPYPAQSIEFWRIVR